MSSTTANDLVAQVIQYAVTNGRVYLGEKDLAGPLTVQSYEFDGEVPTIFDQETGEHQYARVIDVVVRTKQGKHATIRLNRTFGEVVSEVIDVKGITVTRDRD